MTEITRVPLQPIARGSLPKLWLGTLAALLAAGGIAWAALPEQVRVQTLIKGSGESPTMADVALVDIEGKLRNGTVFQPRAQGPLELATSIPGFAKALMQMQRGGKYHIEIPAKLGYGDKANGPIPANSDLTFEVELIDFRSRAEIEQQQQMMQQIQQMQAQQGQGGGPRGGPAGPPPAGLPEGAMPEGVVPRAPTP